MALVSRILGDCPKCGTKRGFGNINVHGEYVLRGCVACSHKEEAWLPEVKKKILYLDQFFFSKAFRATDPRFLKAAERVSRLTRRQLLIVPYSSIHEDETHQWAKHAELLDFIKTVSAGHEFEPAYRVPKLQILRAFKAWLTNGATMYPTQLSDVFRSEINKWDSYFFVDVGGYYKDVEKVRSLKKESIEGLVGLFDGWRSSQASFADDLTAEYEQLGRGYVDTYVELMVSVGGRGDFEAFFNAPIMSEVVEAMLHMLPKEVPDGQRLRKCAEFLMRSEHFRQTPYAWLSSHILATLKAQVKAGHYRKREQAIRKLRGFFTDVEHISTYAPYVDAFVMDNAMAELVSKPTVDLEGRYGVKVFSLNNWDAFFEWMGTVEAQGMTTAHRVGLGVAYPGTDFDS